MQHRYALVDVFTDRPLTGNPLAVFTDARGIEPGAMQSIAREMNLSETTFVLPREGDGDARVRIFTPRIELPFAGHPIIGTAWVIGGAVQLLALRLETLSGTISVELDRADGLRRAIMTQPTPTFDDLAATPFRTALGLTGTAPAEGAATMADNGVRCGLVRADSTAELSALRPNLQAIEQLDVTTVAVWAVAGDGLRMRVFAPRAGVSEDPATGSVAGPLAAQAVRLGVLPAGRIDIRQGEEMLRPSLIEATVADDGTVTVGGACVVIGRGFIQL